MDSNYWRQKWGEFMEVVIPFVSNRTATENSQMPFIHRVSILKQVFVICAFVGNEIAEHAANPALETANLGLDLAPMWISMLVEFVMNPQLPALEGSNEEKMQLQQQCFSLAEKLREPSPNNINIEEIEAAYNNAKQYIPVQSDEDDEEEEDIPNFPALNQLLRQESIANSTICVLQQINEDGTISPVNLQK